IGNNTLRDGNYYACRTDSAGNIIWEKDWGEFYQPNWTGKVIKLTNGKYTICGSGLSGLSGGISDITLTEIDNNGNISFLKYFDFAYADYDSDMMETPDSCLIIAGRKGLTPNSHLPAFIKVDRNGNEIWRRSQSSYMNYEPLRIGLMPDSGYITLGDHGFGTSYYAKYNSSGIMQWIKYQFTSSDTIFNLPSILRTNLDGTFDIFYSTNYLNAQQKTVHGLLIRYDSQGNCIRTAESYWATGGYLNPNDSCMYAVSSRYWLYSIDSNAVYHKLAGLEGTDTLTRWIQGYISTSDGGYLGFGQYTPHPDLFTQFYIVKFAPDGRYQADEFSESVNAYPNPSADGNITLTFDMKVDNVVKIRILTIEGKLIYTDQIFCPANSKTELPIRLDEKVVNGSVYIIEATTPQSVFRKKLIIFRKS
ncbi:MAG: T9SS type A sorting domain-containing protein, partial [Bacteroidia bacterium]